MEKRPYPETLTAESVANWIDANCTPAFPRDAFEIIELYGEQEKSKTQEQLRIAVDAINIVKYGLNEGYLHDFLMGNGYRLSEIIAKTSQQIAAQQVVELSYQDTVIHDLREALGDLLEACEDPLDLSADKYEKAIAKGHAALTQIAAKKGGE